MSLLGFHSVAAFRCVLPPLSASIKQTSLEPIQTPQDTFVTAPVASASMGETASKATASKATTFGLSIPPVFASLVFGAGVMMAKLLPRPFSELMVTMFGTTGVLHAVLFSKGDVPTALEIFLGGCATLRFIKHADLQPFGQLKKLKKKEVPLESRIDPSRLPDLRSLYGRDALVTQAVDQLSALLCLPQARRFFKIHPDRQKLLREIGWVRFAYVDDLKEVKLTMSAGGTFIPDIGVVLVSERFLEVLIHELAHVLHFSIVKKRLTFQDLQRVEVYCRQHILGKESAPFREKIETFMRGKGKAPDFIPEEIRHAAAILIFYIGEAQTMGRHEAVPSFLQCRLDSSLRLRRYRFFIPFNRFIYYPFFPMAWLGGVTRTAYGFSSTFAYDNSFILRRVLKLGPIDSLLGPKSK